MAALLFYGLRKAVYWFILFLALVIIVQVSPPLGPPVYTETVQNALFAANLAIVGTLVFLTIAYVLNKKEVFYRLLQREEEKTTALLHNVLPVSIARDLRENAVGFARQYDEATILFLDLVGFTPLAAANGAEKTVELLNTIYSEFDRLAAEHGVEKIKTIGDSYMAVSGLPEPRSDHAPAAAQLALAMAGFLDDWTDSSGRGVSYRIGLNSGPVAAGVIGIQRFAFDVWGDAVNLASRMEIPWNGRPDSHCRTHLRVARRRFRNRSSRRRRHQRLRRHAHLVSGVRSSAGVNFTSALRHVPGATTDAAVTGSRPRRFSQAYRPIPAEHIIRL